MSIFASGPASVPTHNGWPAQGISHHAIIIMGPTFCITGLHITFLYLPNSLHNCCSVAGCSHSHIYWGMNTESSNQMITGRSECWEKYRHQQIEDPHQSRDFHSKFPTWTRYFHLPWQSIHILEKPNNGDHEMFEEHKYGFAFHLILWHWNGIDCWSHIHVPRIIPCICRANERWCYIGWAHTQNDSWYSCSG